MNHRLLLLAVSLPIAALTISANRGREDSPAKMVAAARAFLEALEPDQLVKAGLPFTSAARTDWQFVPGIYPGVPLADLGTVQKRRAHALLRSALSNVGYLKTTAIMRLEDVLRALAADTGRPAPHRDAGRYSIAVFGTPATDAPWGWRIQGHHVSLNFTCVRGTATAATPAFLGANPAEIRDGPHAGLRVLAAEEDLARELLALLDAEQRDAAIVSDTAPPDILLAPGKPLDRLGEPAGLAWRDMTEAQRELFWQLIEAYVLDLQPGISESQVARLRGAGLDGVHFAWVGGTESGQGHYYRIHGPTFAIEYDNTQNGANHVHRVWHDLTDDFAADLLRQHYAAEPHDRGK